MRFQTTLLRAVEIADQLWLNGSRVKAKSINALQQLTIETDQEFLILENQLVDVEFGAFKAVTLYGTSRNFQAQVVRHLSKKDIS